MKNNKKKYVVITIALVILIAAFVILKNSKKTNEVNRNEKNVTKIEEINFPEGIQIVDSGIFNGSFVEDGSDEEIDEVTALTIANNSEKWLEYAEIIVTTKNDTYHFSISALPSHATACILEQDKKVFTEADEYDIELQHVVFYGETPSLCTNIFEINAQNQQITVKNISDKNITGNIYVYYKLTMDDGYLGGIAYRAKIEDGLSSGEEKNCYAGHYWEEVSELLFVTYVE